MKFEAVIGLEVHAELMTRSKMFCNCPVVDATRARPNTAVCPVCAGFPGVLPVVNRAAVEMGLKVALALDCAVQPKSYFARKNYFYPDLPKGYQISQYEYPLARDGRLPIPTSAGERMIRINRVHLEEDTGKLTHIHQNGQTCSLVDLNRAGVPLLEIVSEPDMHSVEEVRQYSHEIRALLKALGVNSGDMERGVIRFEANVSVRPAGSDTLGTRVEIKNLNSFRALERSVQFQIDEQMAALEEKRPVLQQTLGWDEGNGVTFLQRSKEEAHDYRYFPEPDLPPLVIELEWLERIAGYLPELPNARRKRFLRQYNLKLEDAILLAAENETANYFEEVLRANPSISPAMAARWVTGELFAWMNEEKRPFSELKVTPAGFARLLEFAASGEVNQNTAKKVLSTMLESGQEAADIIKQGRLRQVSDNQAIAEAAARVLAEHPVEVANYLQGKTSLLNWFFGLVMQRMGGKANPEIVHHELVSQLNQAGDGYKS